MVEGRSGFRVARARVPGAGSHVVQVDVGAAGAEAHGVTVCVGRRDNLASGRREGGGLRLLVVLSRLQRHQHTCVRYIKILKYRFANDKCSIPVSNVPYVVLNDITECQNYLM